MSAEFKFIHHACFTVTAGGETLICDPFIDGNPIHVSMEDLKVDYIFVSHAHGDHLGCAYELAKQCDALIITTAEIAGQASENGCKAHAMHIGGTYKFPFGKVRLTPAFHGSGIAGGHACGFIIDFHGVKFYFAGDTSLYGDMQLLQDLDPFKYALLPIDRRQLHHGSPRCCQSCRIPESTGSHPHPLQHLAGHRPGSGSI